MSRITFSRFERGDNWVEGVVENHHIRSITEPLYFQAKLFDLKSTYGVYCSKGQGRVSKFALYRKSFWDEGIRGFSGMIIHYDRGWDIKVPHIPGALKTFNEIMNFLDQAPPLFEETLSWSVMRLKNEDSI